jgi:hypothetical protein
VTFAVLLTAAGAGIAAGIVTGVVSLIKTAFANTVIGTWDGMIMAFVISAALYVLAGVATGVSTLDAGLGVFLAWLTCSTAAVGIHKVVVKPIIAAATPPPE